MRRIEDTAQHLVVETYCSRRMESLNKSAINARRTFATHVKPFGTLMNPVHSTRKGLWLTGVSQLVLIIAQSVMHSLRKMKAVTI